MTTTTLLLLLPNQPANRMHSERPYHHLPLPTLSSFLSVSLNTTALTANLSTPLVQPWQNIPEGRRLFGVWGPARPPGGSRRMNNRMNQESRARRRWFLSTLVLTFEHLVFLFK